MNKNIHTLIKIRIIVIMYFNKMKSMETDKKIKSYVKMTLNIQVLNILINY